MKATYQTKPRREIIALLEQNKDKQYTVDELIEAMGEAAPGKSTVYRLISKLESDGIVRRISREGTHKAVYQLAGKSCCSEHLHIKCVDCGLLIHLDNKAQDELSRTTGFVIDDSLSMLYGRCAACAGRRK